MRIVAPLHRIEDMEKIGASGADEFYFGVQYKPWLAQYGEIIEYNRRGNYGKKANFPTLSDWEQAVRTAAGKGKTATLTVNALRLTSRQIDLIRPLIDRFAKIGGTAVILSEIALIQPVKEAGLHAYLSSCANVKNRYSARFYQSLGVDRIILPRDLTIADIASIRQACPNIQFEAFVLNEPCRFVDGNCLGIHNTKVGSLCCYLDMAPKTYRRFSSHSTFSSEELKENNRAYQRYLKHACGLCALYDLLKAGVDAVKISGRLLTGDHLAKEVQLVKTDLAIAESSQSRTEFFQHISKRNPRYCQTRENCY